MTKNERIVMPNGKTIKFRIPQTILWGSAIALAAVLFVAGIYYAFVETNWGIFYLKAWWDGTAPYHGGMGNLITSPNWTIYRHDLRNLGEPAAAVLLVKSVVAKQKLWTKRISGINVAVRAVAVLAGAVALIVGGTWLIVSGIPNDLHYTMPSWVVNYQLQEIALGVIVGRILHPLWAPAGATLNGALLDWAVDRSSDGYAGFAWKDPIWVRYPIAPPQVRERFVWLREHETEVENRRAIPKWVLAPGLVIAVYLVVTGGLAKYGFAHGLTIPWLAPK